MDAAVFVVLLALSWQERRDWLTLAVALQAVALAVHALRLFSPAMATWTYLSALAAVSYGLLMTLAWGTWRAWRLRGVSS